MSQFGDLHDPPPPHIHTHETVGNILEHGRKLLSQMSAIPPGLGNLLEAFSTRTNRYSASRRVRPPSIHPPISCRTDRPAGTGELAQHSRRQKEDGPRRAPCDSQSHLGKGGSSCTLMFMVVSAGDHRQAHSGHTRPLISCSLHAEAGKPCHTWLLTKAQISKREHLHLGHQDTRGARNQEGAVKEEKWKNLMMMTQTGQNQNQL